MHSPIAATALLEPIPRKPIPPKAAARFAARAFRALFRFPTRTVRKPQAVVALATIKPSRTGEKPQHRNKRRACTCPETLASWREALEPAPHTRAVAAIDVAELALEIGFLAGDNTVADDEGEG